MVGVRARVGIEVGSGAVACPGPAGVGDSIWIIVVATAGAGSVAVGWLRLRNPQAARLRHSIDESKSVDFIGWKKPGLKSEAGF